MPESTEATIVEALRELARPHLERSAPLRRLAEALGRLLIEEADRAGRDGASLTAAPADPTDETPARTGAADGALIEASPKSPVLDLDIGPATDDADGLELAEDDDPGMEEDETLAAPASSFIGAPVEIVDLRDLVEGFRLKAEGCRLQVRRRSTNDPIDETAFLRQMHRMMSQANDLPHYCHLWMFRRDKAQPDVDALTRIARTYDAAAAATLLLIRVDDDAIGATPREIELGVALAAEAKSMVMSAMEETWLTTDDDEQRILHKRLEAEVMTRGLDRPKHMPRWAAADLTGAEDLLARIESADRGLDQRLQRAERIRQKFRQLEYHRNQFVSQRAHRFDEYTEKDDQQKQRMFEVIVEMKHMGASPADARFAEIFDPETVVQLPDEPRPPEVEEVLERLGYGEDEADEPDDGSLWSAQVERVKGWLAGRVVVLSGGEMRREHADRIRDAFDLADLRWIAMSEHASANPLVNAIARPDVDLVLLMVKLSGHDHINKGRRAARDHGRTCVLLKAGYNPERIAHAIVQQASRQFGDGGGA